MKKLSKMSFFDDKKCLKFEKQKFVDICEICIKKKMHRFSNHKSIKANSKRRIIRKNQRFHVDLIENDNIIRISKKKRYVIVFVDDFIDFI